MEATITIARVDRKEGTSKKTGKPWTKFTIVGTDDSRFSTFNAADANMASSSIGQVARVQFDSGEYGNDLTGLIVTNDVPAPTPAAQPQQNGAAPDWDRIAVQKTRCALWVALYNGGLHDPTRAATLVYEAEKDIFGRTSAAPGTGGGLESDIPFNKTV